MTGAVLVSDMGTPPAASGTGTHVPSLTSARTVWPPKFAQVNVFVIVAPVANGMFDESRNQRMLSGAPSGSVAEALNVIGVPRGTFVAEVAVMVRSGGRLPSSAATPARALAIRPAHAVAVQEPGLAVDSSVASTVLPDAPEPALKSRPATPMTSGEEKLVPQTPWTALAGAPSLGPAIAQNGAQMSTVAVWLSPPDPKFELLDGAVPPPRPPTQITPVSSHGKKKSFSTQTMKHVRTSMSWPAFPAAANFRSRASPMVAPNTS